MMVRLLLGQKAGAQVVPLCRLSKHHALQLVRAVAHPASQTSTGSTGTYSGPGQTESAVGLGGAADAPDRRKNPELYRAIGDAGATQSMASAAVAQPAESQPSVSYMVNAPAAGHTAAADGVTGPSSAKGLVKPEILAPVGGWPQLRAAVENGADAVYFGLTDFNARARASNFLPEELPEVMQYLHDRGVKGFVTMNVLVFDEELPRVEQRVRQMAQAGVDAVIVQDLGIVELMRRVAPNLPVHGSTQMSITSAEGAEFAAELGVERVVVGRELSLREISQVRSNSSPEVEAFVHGALCVSYSGQCFSSEAWGGRSANRGQCAQACRMPYGLLVDGQLKDLADIKYLLSPQDLAAVEHVPELILAGVSCFKIEGRLKGPEYVALTTQMYRRAVDTAWDIITGKPPQQAASTTTSKQPATAPRITGHASTTTAAASVKKSTPGGASKAPGSITGLKLSTEDAARVQAAKTAVALSDAEWWDLQQVFARGQDASHSGLTPGFLEGVQHQRLVVGRAPRHRGVFAGKVVRVLRMQPQPQQPGYQTGRERQQQGGRGRPGIAAATGAGSNRGGWAVVVELAAPLKRGDGLVFDAGRPEEQEEGGSVYDLLLVNPQGGLKPVPPSGQVSPHTPPSPAPRSELGHSGQQGGRSKQRGARHSASPAEVASEPVQVAIVFGPGQVDPRKVQPGQLLWRTKDHALDSRLAASYDSLAATDMRRAGVKVAVRGGLGEPLTVVITDENGRDAVGMSQAPLVSATNRALTAEDVSKAVGAVGGDGFKLTQPVDCSALQLGQGLFMAVGELKAARRAAAEALIAARRTSHKRDAGLAPEPVLPALLAEIAASQPRQGQQQNGAQTSAAGSDSLQGQQDSNEAQLLQTQPSGRQASASVAGGRAWVRAAGQASSIRVLCRSEAQVHAALEVPWLEEVVLDFLEVQGLKEAVAAVKAAGRRAVVATPRVLKPDEERLVHFYLRLRADALLVRSAGLLHQLAKLGGPGSELHGLKDQAGQPLVIPTLEGDFSLNAANVLSAHTLLKQGRLSRLAPTHDLSAQQICGLARSLGSDQAAHSLEVVLHHHLPIFHTEHCVFARFLSSGNSYKDCGHPCEHHHVHLRDEKGADHLVLADMGCRNTVFNAGAQSGVFFISDMLRAGLRQFRLELVDQPADVVAPLLQGYRDVLDGKKAPGELWSWLKGLPDANGRSHGVTPGSLGGLAGQQERDRAGMKPTAAALKQMSRSM